MPRILLHTKVKGSIEDVFNLSRNIDFHQESVRHTNEKAIGGTTRGLIKLNESVTWKARHFGVYQTLTSKITELVFPSHFVDEMVKGPFQSFRHEHSFQWVDDHTLMTDVFQYKSPLGILGKLADRLFLERYLRNLLLTRNKEIVRHFDFLSVHVTAAETQSTFTSLRSTRS